MLPSHLRAGRLVPALLAVAVLTGCGAGATAETPIAVQPAAAPSGPAVPDVVGDPLDRARTTLRDAGFPVEVVDLLRERTVTVDREWTVCDQDPGPGPAAAGTEVELGVVRTDETCPGAAPTAAPTTPAAPTTTAAAAPAPKPAPKPAPQPAPEPKPEPRPAPEPERDPEPAPEPEPERADPPPAADDPDSDGGGGGGSAGTVNPGSFCSPAGATGVSSKGKPMVCGPASDGRNRWQGA